MNTKQIFFLTVLIFILGGVVLFFQLNKKSAVVPTPINSGEVIATTTIVTPKIPLETKVVIPKKDPVIIPKPVATTSPVVIPAVVPETVKSFTLAEISLHNVKTDCWTAVNGKVYDITKFLSSHPAGLSKIMKGCGVDSTNIFNNVGAHSVSMLTSGYIGLLK